MTRPPAPASAAREVIAYESTTTMRTAFLSRHFAAQVRPGSDVLISAHGELDIATVPVFEAAVAELDLGSVGRAVLDLGALVFIDAAGLRAVLALHEACLKAGVTLEIRPGTRHVQRVFEITGTDTVLPFRGDPNPSP